MSRRDLLHFSHLGKFVTWCNKNDIETALPTGEWQVLRVKTKKGWDAIYIRKQAHEHFSVSDSIATLVRKFLNEDVL